MDARRPCVAVINSSEDIVGMLAEILEDEGFRCVTAHIFDLRDRPGAFEAFISANDPQVVLIDVPPDYERNWAFVEAVRRSPVSANRSFVVTTTNKRALDQLVGETSTIEAIGKPYDMKQIVGAVCHGYEEYKRVTGDMTFTDPRTCADPRH